jgi:hypothetical protein
MTDLYKIEEMYNKLDTDEKSEIININMAKEKTKEMFLGYGILANCDKKKYGRLVEDLENEYTFGDNKYPKMQQKAYEYAMNYKKYKPKVDNNNSGNRVRDGLAFAMTGKDGQSGRSGGKVFRCYGNRCYGNCDNKKCKAPGRKSNFNFHTRKVINSQLENNKKYTRHKINTVVVPKGIRKISNNSEVQVTDSTIDDIEGVYEYDLKNNNNNQTTNNNKNDVSESSNPNPSVNNKIIRNDEQNVSQEPQTKMVVDLFKGDLESIVKEIENNIDAEIQEIKRIDNNINDIIQNVEEQMERDGDESSFSNKVYTQIKGVSDKDKVDNVVFVQDFKEIVVEEEFPEKTVKNFQEKVVENSDAEKNAKKSAMNVSKIVLNL